ncbi:ZFY26 protein, partial [Polypterus senegalus]
MGAGRRVPCPAITGPSGVDIPCFFQGGTTWIRIGGRSTSVHGLSAAMEAAKSEPLQLKESQQLRGCEEARHHTQSRGDKMAVGRMSRPLTGTGLAGVSCVPANDGTEAGPRNASLVPRRDRIGPEGVAHRRQATSGADRQGEWELAQASIGQLKEWHGEGAGQVEEILQAVVSCPYKLRWETVGSPHRLAWFWLLVLEKWFPDKVPEFVKRELEFMLLLEELPSGTTENVLKARAACCSLELGEKGRLLWFKNTLGQGVETFVEASAFARMDPLPESGICKGFATYTA